MNSRKATESAGEAGAISLSQAAPGKDSLGAIGLDVGGTKLAAGLVRTDGTILARRTIATNAARGGEAVLQDCLALVGELRAEAVTAGVEPVAIGLGVCELVDLAGNVISDQTIKWRGVAVRERFGNELPVFVEADCRAAALCESRLGAGRDFASFLYITIGTGISCTLVIDGRPYRGARGATGTMATSPLPVWCSECEGISRIALEKLASGPGLVKRFNQLTGANALSAEAVLAAASQGEPAARRVIADAGESLGGMLGTLVNVLDPHAIIVGGGLGSAPGAYFELIDATTRATIWSDTQRNLPILRASFGADAGLVGAGLVALGER